MDSEVFSTERYVNSSQVTVSFGVLNDDWCLIQQSETMKGDRMQNDMTIYQNKTAICRTFGIGRQTMYRYEAGIREQIAQGRYNEYAIIDNEINVGVFADYIKYRRMLKDKTARTYVPPFNLQKALAMVVPEEVEDDAV